MMYLALELLTWLSFLIGGFFLITGGVGLIRFPDFYTRIHAAGVTDTLGAAPLLLGMVLQSGDVLTAIKLIMIGFFIFFTTPTATYAIANAAFTRGLKPILHEDEGDGSSNT